MVGTLFLVIAAGYLSVAIGTVIWYQIRQRRDQGKD
jgi:hypothetical protein